MFQTEVVEKIKTHFMCVYVQKNHVFENRAVYEIMWKNTAELGRPQIKIWRMRIACWIPKAYLLTYLLHGSESVLRS